MNALLNWKKLLLGALVGAMLNGCGGGTREDVLDSSGALPDPKVQAVTAAGAPSEVIDSYSKDRDWRCTVQKFTAAEAPDQLATFEPNAAVIWPGSLLQGGTLASGSPEPIAVKRAGGTVLMNLLNAGAGSEPKSYQVKLDEMTQGNVIDAQNHILSNNAGGTPAAFDFMSQRVDSQEELALAMHANVEWLTGSVDAKMKFSTDKRYTRYLLKLTQRYYTMVFETPTSLDGIVDPSVTAADLSRYVGPGNPATYISSVTYGRQFYVLLESTSSAQELEAAIKYVQSGAFVDATVEAQANYKKTQSETIVHAFAIGGGAESALDAVLSASDGKLDGLRAFIVGGATVSGTNPGLPLSYEVRSVADNKLVRVGVATEFSRKTCVPVIKNDGSMALWLDAQSIAPQDIANGFVSSWKGLTTVQNDGAGLAYYFPQGIQGHPALSFNSDAFAEYMKVDLGAGRTVNTDYTIVGVIRTTDANSSLFLQGGSAWDNHNLHVGFLHGGLHHGHWNNDLHSDALPSPNGDVLTFRFSQTEGKAGFQNGVLRGKDDQQTQPLQGFPDARIGSNINAYRGLVGEVRVYAYALSPIEQKTVECELGAKWGLGVASCVDGRPDPAVMRY